MHALSRQVETLMRRVAADIVMPRYQNLTAADIAQKAADDLVTIADKESEIALSDGLARILPEAAVLGEEAVAADPALMDGLGDRLSWIIDPIDGTGNFAAGRPPFGIMVALADRGEALAGWILDPLTGRMCQATQNAGAFIDGNAVTARVSGAAIPVAGISLLYVDPAQRDRLKDRAAGHFDMVDIPRCAAEQYPRLVLGVNDIALFERTLPWDHAAGALFLNEAGGRVARTDGTPYRIGDTRKGMLGAASPAMWDRAAQRFFG